MKFLNETGLAYFLDKIKSLFVTKTDFNKVYDNGVIDAKQIVHKTNSDSSNNYDLTLGVKEDLINNTAQSKGSYITITNQQLSNGTSDKSGNIYINATDISNSNKNPIISLLSDGEIRLDAHNALSYGKNSNSTLYIGDSIRLNTTTTHLYSKLQIYNQNHENRFSFTDEVFDITFGYSDSSKVIHYQTRDNINKVEEKLQFLVNPNYTVLQLAPTKIKAFTDTMQITKDKEIRFKTSSTNSMRLTEGQGFKVFANMYAMPDHATDIENYEDKKKQLLTDNTVQKLLIDLNYNKASATTVNKIAKKTIHERKVCVRKAIRLGSVGQNVSYYHKEKPCILLDKGYYRFKDTAGNVLAIKDAAFKTLDMQNIFSTPMDDGIYKITFRTHFDKLFNIYHNTIINNIISTVISIEDKTENGLSFKEVTIKIENGSHITCKSASPYFNITNGSVTPAITSFSINIIDYPNNTFDINYVDIVNRTNLRKNSIDILVYKRRTRTNKEIKYAVTKYILASKSNQHRIGSDKQSGHSTLRYQRGIGLIKYYRKNILLGTRNININPIQNGISIIN